MKNIEQYKIPILEGINDYPLPPNYNNNNRGPNGSYFTYKFNDLIDALSDEDYTVSFSLRGYEEINVLEVGVPIMIDSTNLVFNYVLNKIDYISSVDIYADNVKINTESLDIIENGTYSVLISSSSDPLIYRQDESSLVWKLVVTLFTGEKITKEILFSWKFKTIVGYSKYSNILDFNDSRLLVSNDSNIEKPTILNKSPSEDFLYTYIFLPNSYPQYEEFRINGFKVDMNEVTQNIFYFGELRPYTIYSSFYPTKGAYTLHLI